MDLRKNRVAMGAVVFIALLGLTLWTINRDSGGPSASEVIPTIDIDRDAVTAMEITRPGGDTVVLVSSSEGWRVSQPVDAEADRSNVESALNRLRDLTLARIVATQEQNYPRLQVDDDNGVRVRVIAGDQTVSTLVIGKYADGMTMIRVDDRPEVFGASGSLRYAFDRELKAWRNRRVVEEETSSVESIAFQSPNGSFRFDKNADAWMASEGQDALGDDFDVKKVAGLVSTAARLTASGFAEEDVSVARAGLNEPTATVTMTIAERTDPVVLELGQAVDEAGDTYLRRQGEETIYVVSKYLSERLQPDPQAFEQSAEPAPQPQVAPTTPAMQGQPQLPPEVMRQLQEQIRAQQRGQ